MYAKCGHICSPSILLSLLFLQELIFDKILKAVSPKLNRFYNAVYDMYNMPAVLRFTLTERAQNGSHVKGFCTYIISDFSLTETFQNGLADFKALQWLSWIFFFFMSSWPFKMLLN